MFYFYQKILGMINRTIKIIADYREKNSTIPEILAKKKIDFSSANLIVGDYLINEEIIIERKTKDDFVQSLIDNRLFLQCKKIKKYFTYQLLIIEGNPYTTKHKITRNAIKGALLSVTVSWQIPIFYTKDKNETCETLIQIGKQYLQEKKLSLGHKPKPKKHYKQQLFLLQAIPDVGPTLAIRLLEKFKTIKKIINASEKRLEKVSGIGKNKAKRIRKYICSE